MRHGEQLKLLDMEQQLPNGLLYKPDFITPEEEEIVLAYIENLPLTHARYDEYFAKRRHIGFGWSWDYERDRFIPGPSLPTFMQGMKQRIAKWLDIPERSVVEALINEYTPGSGIGWHRDNEGFENIIGVSLSGWARMRFRPINKIGDKKAIISMELEPRSAYVMQRKVRWQWQHSVAPVEALRYSITFRTLPKKHRAPGATAVIIGSRAEL